MSALPCVKGYDRPDKRGRCHCEDCSDRRVLAKRRSNRRQGGAQSGQPRFFGPKDAPRTFPLEPLQEFLGVRSVEDTAERLHVSTKTVWRLRAGLTEWQADEYAIRAGLHPGTVWECWWSEEARGRLHPTRDRTRSRTQT